jgi:hypothetical protein
LKSFGHMFLFFFSVLLCLYFMNSELCC